MTITELETIDPTPVDCRSWRRFRYELEVQDLACRIFILMAEDGYIRNDSDHPEGAFALMMTDMLFDPDYDDLWEELVDMREGILDEEMTVDEFRAWLGRVAAHESERLGMTVTADDRLQEFRERNEGDRLEMVLMPGGEQ